jgi:hypothetical protein
VKVRVEGDVGNPITLKGIHFEVESGRRPAGAIFYPSCYRFPKPLSVEADLEPKSVRLHDPSRFPWKIPLKKPFAFEILVRTSKCHCIWKATVPWRSGTESGDLAIADGTKGFQLSFYGGIPRYRVMHKRWAIYPYY